MIKLQITKYKDYTKEEIDNMKGGNFNYNIPADKYVDSLLDVEVTEKQFEAIRKAVLEAF